MLLQMELFNYFDKENEEIKQMLYSGNPALGRILDEARFSSVPAKEIIEACETLNFAEIYKKAQRALLTTEAYIEWSTLYQQQLNQSRGL